MPPSAAPPSIARQALRGALWTGAGQYLLFAFGIAKAIILARLVGREAFGLLAGATVWTSYLGLARLDLRMAALHSREEPSVLDTQFLLESVSAAMAFPLAVLLMLVWPAALPAAGWGLLFVLLGAAQFDALTSTPTYLVDRRLRQDVTGRLIVATAITGFVVPVAVALTGHPLAALAIDAVWPLLLPRLGAVIYTGWRPGRAWTVAEARRQIRLAATMWSIGMLGKITFQFDDWLVFNLRRPSAVLWRGAGVEPEALYDRAYGISKLPMDMAGGLIASNALAIYTERASHGKETLASAYRRMTWGLAWIVFASGAYLFAAIDELVYILGDAWVPMVPLLRLMMLFIVGRPLFQNCAQVLLAMEHERDVRRASAVQAAFLAVACPPAVYAFGAAGAAGAVSVMSVIGVAISERAVMARLGHSSWSTYGAPAAAAALTIALSAVAGVHVARPLWLAAIVKAGICGVVFGGTLLTFDRRAAVDVWRTARRAWRSA